MMCATCIIYIFCFRNGMAMLAMHLLFIMHLFGYCLSRVKNINNINKSKVFLKELLKYVADGFNCICANIVTKKRFPHRNIMTVNMLS